MKKSALKRLFALFSRDSKAGKTGGISEDLLGNWCTDTSEAEVLYISFHSDQTYDWCLMYEGVEEARKFGRWSSTEQTITVSPKGDESATVNYSMPDNNTLEFGGETTYYRCN